MARGGDKGFAQLFIILCRLRVRSGATEQQSFAAGAIAALPRKTAVLQLPLRTAKGIPVAGYPFCWWEEVDSNYRSRRRQIYSLIHLAALESSRSMKLEMAPR